MSIPSLLLSRIKRSFLTLPTASGWIFTLSLIAASAPPLAVCGVLSNAFSLPHAHFSPPTLLKLVFVPCLAEEVLWRVLMNPHPLEAEDAAKAAGRTHFRSKKAGDAAPPEAEATDQPPHPSTTGVDAVGSHGSPVSLSLRLSSHPFFWAVVSTLIYIVAHPCLAYAVRPPAIRLFSHPAFLAAVAVLGISCVASYHRTGSVWAPVLCHWAAVAVWQSLGGRHQAPF